MNELAARKTAVRARIAVRREQVRAAAAEVARPLALVEQGFTLWRSVPLPVKTMGVPLGLYLARNLGRRFPGPFGWLRYAPQVAQVAWSVLHRRREDAARGGSTR